MSQATNFPTHSVAGREAARLKRLFADAFGADVLCNLSLRLQALGTQQEQRRDAIAWTRLALRCDARPS